MSGVEITYSARDIGPLQANLEKLLRGLDDTSEMMDEVGGMLVSSTLNRFENERGPDGQRWKPSARARQEGGQTLTDSARLRTSITHTYDRDSVAVGTNVIYAGIHQLGGTIRPKGDGKLKFSIGGGFVQVDKVEIPARSFLGVDADDEAEILNIAEDYLTRIMDR